MIKGYPVPRDVSVKQLVAIKIYKEHYIIAIGRLDILK